MRIAALLALLAGCTGEAPTRRQRVLTILAEDNYAWALRDPALVAMKLKKMQRGAYEWMRGTPAVWWGDVMDVGAARAETAFGDPASSRVLLVGDPHPENIGTFRAADGSMFVDFNDFDSSGYGPYGGDVRRLAAGMIVAAGDPTIAADLAHRVGEGYAAAIAMQAAGVAIEPLGLGAHKLLDKLLGKARDKGDAGDPLDEIAPADGGERAMVFADIDPVGDDGVIENRQVPAGIDGAEAIQAALAAWPHPEAGALKLRARRLGAGVSSYAALRYLAVLEGATPAIADDRVIELKESRNGVIVHGVPQLDVSEWDTAAARVVDAQRRLQARRDGDALLGTADFGGLSLKIKDDSGYQRGVDAADLAELAAGNASKREQLLELGRVFGGLLAGAHGRASTRDGVQGVTVIAPLLAGREAEFADEITRFAVDDAAQVVADHELLAGEDLGAAILPVAP